VSTQTYDIENMPRGGPDGSFLDRWLETDRLEYIDRDDVDNLKRTVVRSLDRLGSLFGYHNMFARIALNEVTGVAQPKILELGSGHGGLSRALLEMHPFVHVTVTDIELALVAAIASGSLGKHPRATVREMDATAINAPDRCYDLAVFALSLHHLPPLLAARTLAEGTRVANKLLIIDLRRPPPALHIMRLASMLPVMLVPVVHDGIISSLRAYSPSALRALARHADPTITVDLWRGPFRLAGRPQVVVASRKH
jgi:ubiquinone/menaquinone biosynthesis C-methylase UbiE